jgi:Zn-dependent peptidase ImmA (M78 family)
MANEGIPVNGAIIVWGRVRAGLTLEEATQKFRYFPKWESGERLPTYPQLEQLADALKLPIAVFFFPEPPTLPPIRESFRTLPDADYEQMPREVRLMLRKAKALQLGLAELTSGRNPAERFILRDVVFSAEAEPDEMAARVRAYLGVSLEEQFAWSDDDTGLKVWRKAIHDVGVFVFKDAFRAPGYHGFSLFDPVFPLIYVSNSTTKSRQIFTLLHELGHLLLHTSGVDTRSGSVTPSMSAHQRRIEVLCNRFAAQFLVPDDVFRTELRGRDHSPGTAEYLAKRFNVSREVIYRKFLDRRWITQTEYERATAEWNAQRQPGGDEDGGGNHYYTKLAYLGREYVGLVLHEYHRNRIDRDQLADFLDTKPKNVATLEEYYLQGGI